MIYKCTMKEAEKKLGDLIHTPTEQVDTETVHNGYEAAHACIRDPWEKQLKKRKRKSGPHLNSELLRLWERKKLYSDRCKWRPSSHNKNR